MQQQNLTEGEDGSQLRQGTDQYTMDLHNNEVSTSRSGIPNNGQQVAPGSSALAGPSAASNSDHQKNE